jgi:glycosyltransferase involved in cell wall biosynthesis
MRILFCNKYNFPFSGTEVHLFELMELMRVHGHEVALFSMADPRGMPTSYDQHFVHHIDFKSQMGWWRRARLAPRAIYSVEARRKIRDMIWEFRPDVAHVRNIYHHLTPSILWELRAHGVPVLYHLNDFKLLCPSYNMVWNGEACERCKGGAFWHVLLSDCYPGLGSRVTLASEAYAHRWMETYRNCVDLFLAPSRFVRDKFVEHGWDAARFQELPHFQSAHELTPVPASEDAPLLYYGRLSSEKGVDDLLQAMQHLPDLHLVIAGDGPQRAELEKLRAALRLSNVEFVGSVDTRERDRLIRRSRFTVFPSHAYETLGKTILESYAEGRAVVATDLGSRREFVRNGETGLLYRCGDVHQLVHSIRMLAENPSLRERMGQAGWELVRERHSPEGHYSKLCGIYEELVSRKSAGQSSQFIAWIRKGAGESRPANPRLRVAFIGGRGVISKYSGIESFYEETGKRLAKMGHEVTVYCRNYFTPALEEWNGMRLVRLPTFRLKHFETVIHTLLSTMHAVICRYDLVHYHALGPALFAWIPRLFGTKTVVTVQGLDWKRKKWGRAASAVLRIGEEASAYLPNQTMVVSRALQRHYREVHGIETSYVPNGGVLRDRTESRKIREWGLEPDRYLLFLGRFSPEKNCHLLIQAFEQIDRDVKLVMAGGASYGDKYSRELMEHASDSVKMLGWVSGEDLDELLTHAMIFVLPSDMEGLSLALLDAMGAGLCVLASDVPENCEAVEGAGFTFRCGDVADLADRLRFLIANPTIREAAGRAARKRVEEEYGWDKTTCDIERAYFEALGIEAELLSRKPNARELGRAEVEAESVRTAI